MTSQECIDFKAQNYSWFMNDSSNMSIKHDFFDIIEGTTLPDGSIFTWSEWTRKIRGNFDKKFWVGEGGYYGDTCGSTVAGADR